MQEDFISGVHNYCDRWCERCPFTARCQVYATEQELSDESKDPMNPAFWENIKKKFEDMLDMLNQTMAKLGIELDEGEHKSSLPETDPAIIAFEEKMRNEAMGYSAAVEGFFRNNSNFFEQKEHELAEQIEDGQPVDVESWQFFQDAVDVVRWYQYFIPAKIDRAVGGLSDMGESGDPRQSDANGSAKVALIALERSLAAWELVSRRLPEKQDEIVELQRRLQQLRTRMTELFPDWRVFHRPGFDDEPEKTLRLDFNPN
jgi:hypothetical protein